jgi:hypothetical protein
VVRTRSRELGPEARPVAIPEDIDDPSLPKATGCIRLPVHIRWSEPLRMYDLDQRADRQRVYEQVLREGTADDVRFYVRLDQLIDVWDELVLPPNVRRTWEQWLASRGIAREC